MNETVQVVFFVIGLLATVMAACFALIYFIGEFLDKIQFQRKHARQESESAIEKIGEELECEAYRFSESPAVFAALLIIGKQIQRDHSFSVIAAREAWRDAMKDGEDES